MITIFSKTNLLFSAVILALIGISVTGYSLTLDTLFHSSSKPEERINIRKVGLIKKINTEIICVLAF